MNKIDGRRISAAEAYLTPEVRRARQPRASSPHTLVRRVLFAAAQGARRRGRGPGRRRRCSTCGRVVLCAGAINTPGILLRSGVGPRAEVERLGCELVADVPGGRRGCSIIRARRSSCARAGARRRSHRAPADPDRAALRVGGGDAPERHAAAAGLDAAAAALRRAAREHDVLGRQAARARRRCTGRRPTRARGRASTRSCSTTRTTARSRSTRCSWPTGSRSTRRWPSSPTHFWPSARVLRSRARGRSVDRRARATPAITRAARCAMGARGDPAAAADARGRVLRRRGPARRRRQPHAHHPLEQHPPRRADDRRAHRRVAERGRTN